MGTAPSAYYKSKDLGVYPIGNAYTCDFLCFFHKDVILNDCRTENDEGKLLTIRGQKQVVITHKTGSPVGYRQLSLPRYNRFTSYVPLYSTKALTSTGCDGMEG